MVNNRLRSRPPVLHVSIATNLTISVTRGCIESSFGMDLVAGPEVVDCLALNGNCQFRQAIILFRDLAFVWMTVLHSFHYVIHVLPGPRT